ncbi:MAG: hypothetical protein CME16_00580 [Gemmatimonadetes bacterium]|nr:hypothetical protein [Gemmatimonadota bacterium]
MLLNPRMSLYGKIILLVALSASTLMLPSCGEQTAEELFAAAEAAAADSTGKDLAREKFTTFLNRYPKHLRCDEALRHLAMIARQDGEMAAAIGYYERLLADYSKSEFGDEAQFMIAFIYEEHLQDKERARQAYQSVIERYPESDLAASARRLLPHVGRNPEEWVNFQDEVP